METQYTQQIEPLTKKLEDIASEREALRGTLKETESKYQVQISDLNHQIGDSNKTVASLKEQVAILEVNLMCNKYTCSILVCNGRRGQEAMYRQLCVLCDNSMTVVHNIPFRASGKGGKCMEWERKTETKTNFLFKFKFHVCQLAICERAPVCPKDCQ